MKKLSKLGGIVALFLVCLLVVISYDDQEILIESQESKAISGGPVFNKIKYFQFADKDVWMMNQSHHGSTASKLSWDRLAIVVDKTANPKTARFYQLGPGTLEWKDGMSEKPYRVSCFMCHSNGPRVLRPNLSSPFSSISLKDRIKIQLWNLRIKSYGRVALSGEHQTLDTRLAIPVRFPGTFENEPLEVAICVMCHKESGLFAQGPLLRQHIPTIQFMTETGHMPPMGFWLSAQEKLDLENFIAGF